MRSERRRSQSPLDSAPARRPVQCVVIRLFCKAAEMRLCILGKEILRPLGLFNQPLD